jgi:hypothetical protein
MPRPNTLPLPYIKNPQASCSVILIEPIHAQWGSDTSLLAGEAHIPNSRRRGRDTIHGRQTWWWDTYNFLVTTVTTTTIKLPLNYMQNTTLHPPQGRLLPSMHLSLSVLRNHSSHRMMKADTKHGRQLLLWDTVKLLNWIIKLVKKNVFIHLWLLGTEIMTWTSNTERFHFEFHSTPGNPTK